MNMIEPAQSYLFESLVLPLLHATGFMTWADSAYDATGVFLIGLLQIAILYILIRPWESLRPAEHWQSRTGVRVDILYTLLSRTGILALIIFFLLDPIATPFESFLHIHGLVPENLEDVLPTLQTRPLLAFMTYVIIIDFFEYWYHRMQHRFDWWWGLHSIHHSQRHMSLWTDDRNHLLDILLHSVWLASIANLIGIPGSQFLFVVILIKGVESLSHANIRMDFGRWGDRILVSPRYHRVHHGMDVGHSGSSRGSNFAVLLPIWDLLFGTARRMDEIPQTGILDQLQGAEYGENFISQQVAGFSRMIRAFTQR